MPTLKNSNATINLLWPQNELWICSTDLSFIYAWLASMIFHTFLISSNVTHPIAHTNNQWIIAKSKTKKPFNLQGCAIIVQYSFHFFLNLSQNLIMILCYVFSKRCEPEVVLPFLQIKTKSVAFLDTLFTVAGEWEVGWRLSKSNR